jgi:glycosyltransferase 2 family protein
MEGKIWRMKKTLLTILQVLVTVGILVWIFHDPAKRAQMFDALRTADKGWILAAIGAYGFVEVVATIRWMLLLRVQGVVLAPLRLLSLLMIGIFFNLFMPGGTGGDVVKIFYLLKETPGKKTAALLATLMDRIIGLLALMIISVVVLWLRYDFLKQTETTQKLTWSLMAIVIASFVGIFFTFLITGFKLAHKLPQKMPMRDTMIDISAAYHAYAHAWGTSLVSLGLSFLVHIGSFSVFYFGALALSISAKLGDLFSVIPIINTLSALPISVGGMGVREGLSQELFGQLCGIAAPKAVAMALVAFVVLVFWAVLGGLIYMFYRPSEHARLSEIKTEIRNLGHEIAEDEK